MMGRVSRAVTLGVFLAASLGVQPAAATELRALVGNTTLVDINVELATVLAARNVTGINSQLVGIDVRQANGLLYGVFRNGVIARINPDTGAATQVSSTGRTFAGRHAVDFNPVADRLRVINEATGTNLRINVDTGDVTTDTAVTGPATNPFGDTNVRVRGAAYANSGAGPKPLSTLLYDIDAQPAALYLQIPPNDGTLVPVGLVGRGLAEFGFDIYQDSQRRNRGLMLAGSSLVEVDLAGGKALSVRPVSNSLVIDLVVRDIAILP
jgi:hypothetical protein